MPLVPKGEKPRSFTNNQRINLTDRQAVDYRWRGSPKLRAAARWIAGLRAEPIIRRR